MATVIFYEKTGCKSNHRQKLLLQAAGHDVVTRDILDNVWTMSNLLPFFQNLPLSDWFNKAAPQIKSGKVDPGKLLPEQALALMVHEPLLIRRPLMQIGTEYVAGFDSAKLNEWIGLKDRPSENMEKCSSRTKDRPRKRVRRCGTAVAAH